MGDAIIRGNCQACGRAGLLVRVGRKWDWGIEEVRICERCLNVLYVQGHLDGQPADPGALDPCAVQELPGGGPARAPRSTVVSHAVCPVCGTEQLRCHNCGTPTIIAPDGGAEVCPCCLDGAGQPMRMTPAEHGWR